MHLTDLQYRILSKMRLSPMSGDDIKQKCGYDGSSRSFAAALSRMRDKGLIDCRGMEPIAWEPTPDGLSAFLDDPRSIKTA